MKIRSILPACLILMLCTTAESRVIPVDSPAVQFSPALWVGDTGRGGSKFRETWNNGAWVKFDWTCAANGTAAVRITNAAAGSAVAYFVDGRLTDDVPVTSEGSIDIKDIPAGDHELVLYTRNSQQKDRFDSRAATPNRFRVSGFEIDDASVPKPIAGHRPWVMIVGDSITEGIVAGPDRRDSSIADYAFLVGRGLDRAGYDCSVNACGYSGWIHPGDATDDVPGYFMPGDKGRWNKIDAATSLLDRDGHASGDGRPDDPPAMVVFNYGVNEAIRDMDRTRMRDAMTASIAAWRKAAPAAKIVVMIPPGLYDEKIYPHGPAFIETIRSGVRPDDHVSLLDLGPEVGRALGSHAYGGDVHPNAAGHAYLAPLVLESLLKRLPPVERNRPVRAGYFGFAAR